MDNSIRLQYLDAMGVENWMPKVLSTEKENVFLKRHDPVSVLMPEKLPETITSTNLSVNEDNWERLEQDVSGCQKCELYKTRTQTVFGTGNRDAEWLFIGEAPGENEDLEGKPFVGNAGLLLTEMMRALGLSRDDIFIANILKCRPPNNRDPKVDEIKCCHDYLMRQQALIKPKIIVAVGRVAAQKLLKTTKTLRELRGQVHKIEETPLVVVYHPAYLLRSLTQKRAAWQDLQLAVNTYEQL